MKASKPLSSTPVAPSAPFSHINGVCYTIGKSSSTTAQAFELVIKDGVVTSCTEVTRAPDMPVSGITKITLALWEIYRTQKASDFVKGK